VTSRDDVNVDVAETPGQGPCAADYNPYRQLVVVDRDSIPPPTQLPSAVYGSDDGNKADGSFVDSYPDPAAD